MTYTLVTSQKEQEKIGLCDAFGCFSRHLRVTRPDAQGNVRAYFRDNKCINCNQATRCRCQAPHNDAWLNNQYCAIES